MTKNFAKWNNKMNASLLLFAIVLSATGGYSAVQSSGGTLTLRTPMDGDQIVWGQASPDAGPITIQDISTKAQIGTAKAVSKDGVFSAAVNAPLVKGHQITATDQNGNTSAPVTVTEAGNRPGPAPQ